MSNQGASGPSLVIRHTGQVFSLGQAPVTIGRLSDNTIVLADPQVSRHHATITWQAGAFVIQDLGSANGTYVNNQRIASPRALRDGDAIQTGNTHFDVRLGPAAGEADRTMIGAAAAPETGRRSALPIILGLLLAGIVIVGLVIAAILLLSGDRDRVPTVAIQSPPQDAQIAMGNEIILQASAAGAPDIIRLELAVDDVLVGTSVSPDSEGTGSLTASEPWSFGQTGPHVVSAVAFTASGETSAQASVNVEVVDAIGQGTPSATSTTPSTEIPSPDTPTATPTPTASPSTSPPTDTSLPDTPTPTDTATPTSTPTPTPTPTATPHPLPEIQFFQASPDTITAGDCTTLEWGAVTNATAVIIDQGIGGVATPGSQSVCPANTTTYLMTATGTGGTATASVTVTVQPGLPDLTVESIVFVPSPSVQNQDNEVRVTIRNIGAGPAGAFDWEWQPGSAVPLGGNVPGGLNAGQSLVVIAIWHPASWYANLPTVARVDVGNAVTESDETNNERQVNVQVVPPADVTVTLYSQAALDGFRANNGGGNTSVDIRMGNGAMVGSPSFELVTRGFMSFDLSGIPAGASIQSIELRFFQTQLQGNPYGKLGNPLLKHVVYGSSLENADFDTPELHSATLAPHTSPGQWYTITSTIIADWINQDLVAGRTRFQMRLQFATETDGDGLQDSVSFESGDNHFGTGNLPQLTITYTP
jgi:hypothetical protein